MDSPALVVGVGDRIKFRGERQRYTVQAASDRFAVCTKPFNLENTVLYTIIDFEQLVRGADDYILGKYDYDEPDACVKALAELDAGEMKVSRRNNVALEIEEVSRVNWENKKKCK